MLYMIKRILTACNVNPLSVVKIVTWLVVVVIQLCSNMIKPIDSVCQGSNRVLDGTPNVWLWFVSSRFRRLISSSETQRRPVVLPDDKEDTTFDLKSTDDDRLPCVNARQETNKSLICGRKWQTMLFYFRINKKIFCFEDFTCTI